MPTGIPGPLKSGPISQIPAKPADAPTAARVKIPEHGDEDSVFYSLDSLQAESTVAPPLQGSQQKEVPACVPETVTLVEPSTYPDNSSAVAKDHCAAQIQLRAIFSTNAAFTLDNIATLTAQLPGVSNCLLKSCERSVLATTESESVETIEDHQNPPQPEAFAAALELLGQATVDGILLRSTSGSVSCFSNAGFSLMARHEAENPPAGLWEKLFLITQAGSKLGCKIK
ncbi:MAG: hypothetical protein QM496_04920 [Verrucomicrobiota bacterium]